MNTRYIFPFGQPVTVVEQQDRIPKQIFVLGVYASAVHAHWINPHGKTNVRALAVASEPYIFWRGDNATAIVSRIEIPAALGRLEPADQHLNGPSGKALDNYYLTPLGLERESIWLCDLVPHTCLNPNQRRAVEQVYNPCIAQFGLPVATVPPVPNVLADAQRQLNILSEIRQAEPQLIILLGDAPIQWFLSRFDPRWQALSSFGKDPESYGTIHQVTLQAETYNVLPLVHPRQAAKLSAHSRAWYGLHRNWIDNHAGTLLK